MLTTEIKQQFILLRAENKSYSQIIKELNISKSSCIKLSKKLNSEIAQAKADRLQSLYNDYFMTKEARIQHLQKSQKKKLMRNYIKRLASSLDGIRSRQR